MHSLTMQCVFATFTRPFNISLVLAIIFREWKRTRVSDWASGQANQSTSLTNERVIEMRETVACHFTDCWLYKVYDAKQTDSYKSMMNYSIIYFLSFTAVCRWLFQNFVFTHTGIQTGTEREREIATQNGFGAYIGQLIIHGFFYRLIPIGMFYGNACCWVCRSTRESKRDLCNLFLFIAQIVWVVVVVCVMHVIP